MLPAALLETVGDSENRQADLSSGAEDDGTAALEGDGPPGIIEEASAGSPEGAAPPEEPGQAGDGEDSEGHGCASTAAAPLSLALLVLRGLAARRRRGPGDAPAMRAPPGAR